MKKGKGFLTLYSAIHWIENHFTGIAINTVKNCID